LQERAKGRVDRYLHHFRRTFDQNELRPEILQAKSELQRSVELFRAAGARADAARSLVKLGDVRRYLNEWDSAILTYEEAAAEARAAGDALVECKAFIGDARAHLIGKKSSGRALELVRQAIPLAQRTNDAGGLFAAWDLLAQVQIAEGDHVGAADSMNRAFAVAGGVKDEKDLFYGYLDRADVYLKFAERCDYERDFRSCLDAVERARRDYESAYATAKRLGWDGLAQETQGFIQRLEVRKQMIQSQERMHTLIVQGSVFSPTRASDVVVSERFTSGENAHIAGVFAWIESQGGLSLPTDARGAYIQGLLNEASGKRDQALEWYLRSVDLLEQDRRSLYDERARGAFVEDKVEFYYTAMLHLLDRRRYREAFDLMERSRSRVMADLLATRMIGLSSPQEGALYGAMLQLRSEVAQIQSCLFAARSEKAPASGCEAWRQAEATQTSAERGVVLAEQGEPKPGLDTARLDAALKERQSKYNSIRGRIEKETPRLARLVTSQPASLDAVQATLARYRSEMLAYLALESQLVIWHIKPDSVRACQVFLPRSALKDKVEKVRQSLTDPRRPYDHTTAHELYFYLVAPVSQGLTSDHLVIVPDEDLHYLPFQALPTAPGGDYLGESHRISYVPSATVLASLEPVGALIRPQVLAVADPSLRYAPGEVRALGERFSGSVLADELVKEAEVKKRMEGMDLVHFAVHGSFVSDEPLLSYLHLGAGDGDDGKLTAAEMYGLPLDAAKLVVLSACDTGSVRATHANEVIGMVRGLLFAGADALLLSAWKIDDKATAEWMRVFYAAAQNHPPAAAARMAIKQLSGMPGFQHPYYWSPFLLIGR
jgi:CHAT domain-containing protein